MKILAAIDFSITSESLLKVTKQYAKILGAEVFLIHAEPEQPHFEDEDGRDLTPETVRLKKDAATLKKAGVHVTPVFTEGPVCETIVDEAIRLEVDLIIAGAHGHNRSCKGTPIGHISECLLLKTNIPVLIVPGRS